MAHWPNEYQTLAAEALLKMIIIHKGGHWHYTLACITELTDFERIELTITLFNPACR